MPADFDMTQHGPRKLRVTTFCGLVFGTLSPDAPEFEAWLGPEIVGRVRRVLGNRRLEIIGRFTQALPNNWKLYFENVRDTYHASLLHLFFATFRITRLSSRRRRHWSARPASTTPSPRWRRRRGTDSSYQGLRSDKESFRLADPSLLGMHDEFHDDIQLQILSIFPGFVLQQMHNALAVRQIVPRGVDATDLNWTYLGFADDTPELRAHRLKQNNLVGPAGYVSMEDGCGRRLRAARHRRGGRRTVGDRDGRRRRRDAGDARDRGLGARLLEGVSRAHGTVSSDERRRDAVPARRAEQRLRELHRCRPAGGMAGPVPGTAACYKITTADNHRRGYAAGIDLCRFAGDADAIASRRCARPTSTSARAIATSSGMPALRAGDAGEITAETPFLVVRTMRDGRMDLFAAGVYLDRVRDEPDGRLRFAERIVVCDSSRFDTLLAIPL